MRSELEITVAVGAEYQWWSEELCFVVADILDTQWVFLADISGYFLVVTIPLKTKVMVNVWAIERDSKSWDDAESFKPERFEQYSVDFNGNNFEYLPFGSGRRICPRISFGFANVYFPLAQLLYHFTWKLPRGMEARDLDLAESAGVTSSLKNDLYLIATPYQP
ncbi:hypothetical protein P3S68_020026 [Capsicum galapagoense]